VDAFARNWRRHFVLATALFARVAIAVLLG
jgi:hypothetical protein